jgi:hypothetical protein
MNKNNIYNFFVGFFLILILLIFVYSFTFSHECAHREISSKFGCNNGLIKVNYDGSGSYICLNQSLVSEKYYIQEIFLHSLNEIFGYNIQYIYLSILCVGLLFILVYIFINIRKK